MKKQTLSDHNSDGSNIYFLVNFQAYSGCQQSLSLRTETEQCSVSTLRVLKVGSNTYKM